MLVRGTTTTVYCRIVVSASATVYHYGGHMPVITYKHDQRIIRGIYIYYTVHTYEVRSISERDTCVLLPCVGCGLVEGARTMEGRCHVCAPWARPRLKQGWRHTEHRCVLSREESRVSV